MNLDGIVGRAKGLVGQAKNAAGSNPEKVRAGLDKAQNFVDEKTGGKYSDAVAKGKQGLEGALGVTTDAKEEFRAEMAREEKAEPVKADPVDGPDGIGRPESI